MTNLYETLGVKKEASRDEVRKAYRKKAKTAHPDAGGTKESFALVQRAHDILTDDERRKKYDSTGDESEKKPDNAMSEIINIVAATLDAVMQQAVQRGVDPVTVDMIGSMKSTLKTGIVNAEGEIDKIKKQVKKMERMLGRFTAKEGENFLEGVIVGKITSMNCDIKRIEESLTAPKKALEMIGKFDFKAEVAKQQEQQYSPQMFWLNMANTGGL